MSGPGPHTPPDEATIDLLIKQISEGLSAAEQQALGELDSVSQAYGRDLERTAAAISLIGTTAGEPLPASLRTRLEAGAAEYLSAPAAAPAARSENVVSIASRAAAAPPRRHRGAGWWAAAACLVLAAAGWLRSPGPAPVAATAPPQVEPTPAPTVAQLRSELLARPDAVKLAIGATKDPASGGVTGDVVWDPIAQRGYLHFVGLAANDPRIQQYQLWIFDAERDQRFPVDGGVFDVPAGGGDVVVAIHAAVPVHTAKLFAVTIEKPGGVVVSSREHIVAVAQAT